MIFANKHINTHNNQQTGDTPPDDKLVARYGSLDAPRLMGWQNARDAWRYVVRDEIAGGQTTRFKAHDSKARKKYSWGKTGKPDDVRYYHPPNIREAIQAANGTLYIANGEASVLAFVAAGVHNVLSWFGEKSVPKTLADDLQSVGVTKIINHPDRDEAGRKSAIKVRNYLYETDIECVFKKLPSSLPNGGDTNDLWIQVGFDSRAFIAALDACETLLLPQYNPKPQRTKKRSQIELDSDYERAVEQLKSEVARLLGYDPARDFKTDGWSKKSISSPFRTDNNPSFGYNIESGAGNDFAGDSYNLKSLCDHFGLTWPTSRRRKPTPRPRPKTTQKKVDSVASKLNKDIQDKALRFDVDPAEVSPNKLERDEKCFEQGNFQSWWTSEYIPLWTLSGVLNAQQYNSTAILLHDLHQAFHTGKIRAHAFTMKNILAHTRLSRPSATKALSELMVWGFVKDLAIEDLSDSLYSKVLQNATGRPPALYTIDHEGLKYLSLGIERVLRESYYKKHLAPVKGTMTTNIDLTPEEFKAWRECVETDHCAYRKRTERKLRREMEGDQHWDGWMAMLNEDMVLPYSDDFKSIKDLRANMLRVYLEDSTEEAHYAADLCRLLGLSSTTSLQNIYDAAAITTKPRYVSVEMKQTSDLDKAIRQIQGVCRGRVLQIEFVSPNASTVVASVCKDDYKAIYAQYGLQATQINAVVRVASEQILHDPEQYALMKAAQEAEKAHETAEKAHEEAQSDQASVADPAQAENSSTTVPNATSEAPHLGDTYDPRWLHYQVNLAIDLCTRYHVTTSGQIEDDDGEVVGQALCIEDKIRFLIANAVCVKPSDAYERF